MLRSAMTRDGRALDHGTLETIRTMARRARARGRAPERSHRWLTAVRGRGHGLHALASRPAAHGP
jgi:hypothetical protein